MEGLLQGRVIYTFDEFKKRKLDKLFHYIVDILTILVPYVFKNQYLLHLESIISHYFDVFKVNKVLIKVELLVTTVEALIVYFFVLELLVRKL